MEVCDWAMAMDPGEYASLVVIEAGKAFALVLPGIRMLVVLEGGTAVTRFYPYSREEEEQRVLTALPSADGPQPIPCVALSYLHVVHESKANGGILMLRNADRQTTYAVAMPPECLALELAKRTSLDYLRWREEIARTLVEDDFPAQANLGEAEGEAALADALSDIEELESHAMATEALASSLLGTIDTAIIEGIAVENSASRGWRQNLQRLVLSHSPKNNASDVKLCHVEEVHAESPGHVSTVVGDVSDEWTSKVVSHIEITLSGLQREASAIRKQVQELKELVQRSQRKFELAAKRMNRKAFRNEVYLSAAALGFSVVASASSLMGMNNFPGEGDPETDVMRDAKGHGGNMNWRSFYGVVFGSILGGVLFFTVLQLWLMDSLKLQWSPVEAQSTQNSVASVGTSVKDSAGPREVRLRLLSSRALMRRQSEKGIEMSSLVLRGVERARSDASQSASAP